MKVAIIHYWLVGMRGGEKVVEALLDLYPQADIYTHVVDHDSISAKLSDRVKSTSFISKLPQAVKRYQSYLPLMPYALEELDLTDYDLIISSESGPAKGVVTSPESLHVCYCHSPMRYVWDMYHEYTNEAGFLKKLIMSWLIHKIRIWDLASSFRVDHFIANSSFIGRRISKYYHRDSEVIFPPIDVSQFEISETIEDYFLIVGQLVAYKNVELAVKAFNESGRRLVIIGEGDESGRLKALAGKNIEFLGYQSFDVVKAHFSRCNALIFPGVEDFGMVPVETMASGRPVIALAKGGALDSVVDGVSGVFFNDPTVTSLNDAVSRFERDIDSFNPREIRKHAANFDILVFQKKVTHFINSKMKELK